MENNPDNNFGAKTPEKKTAQENTRPDFLAATDKQKKQDAAAQGLGAAEKSALGDEKKEKQDGLASAKEAESKINYTGGGKSARSSAKKAKSGKAKFNFKGGGAGLAAAIAVIIIGGFAALVQVFQPFDFLAQFKETFNSMHGSTSRRADRFFREQMKTGRTKNPIRGSKLFGQDFKISEKQQKKLAEKGIEYDDKTFKDSSGNPIKVLKYKNDAGDIKVVGADENAVRSLNSLNLGSMDTGVDGVKFDAEAIDFKKAYASDNKFFGLYNAGSMTWRGAISNWFGKNTAKFLSKNNLLRNKFEDWKDKKKSAGSDADTKKLLKETIRKNATTVKEGGFRVTENIEDVDEDGNKTTRQETTTKGGGTYDAGGWDESKAKAKIKDIADGHSGAASAICAVVNVIGAINLLVHASEMLQVLNITTAFFEVIDKTEYGLGGEAPINEIANALNEERTIDHVITDNSGGSQTVPGKKKTAMEAESVTALYNNKKVNPKDPSVQSFNVMTGSKNVLSGVGENPKDAKKCYIGTAAAAGVSLTLDSASIAACVASVATGVGIVLGCGALAAKLVSGMFISIGIAEAVEILVKLITPRIASMLTRDLIEDLGGEDLGNVLTLGANAYQGSAHRGNGGSLSNIEKYEEFAVLQDQVIAENSRLERESLSPFDITSSNTFMGSFVKQLAGFINADSLMSVVAAGESSVVSSIGSILPTASATSIADKLPDSLEEYEDVNPYLSSIGAVGDAFGYPYTMTDVGTMEEDPADVIDTIENLAPAKCEEAEESEDSGEEEDEKASNFTCDETSDGNVTINEGSNLARYIRYCGERYSPFGVADQNIADEITGNALNNSVVAGSTPVLGEVLDIIQNTKMVANIGWISGESCVAGNELDAAESPNWEEAKYYQRFVEDQSLAESMGIIEQSAASAYLDKYYEEHPLDNSYEGILARYSGLTKENVIAVLDIVDYYNFVANYDASDRYAFGESAMDEGEVIRFDNENVLAGEFILQNQIVYADVRNRVFTV